VNRISIILINLGIASAVATGMLALLRNSDP